MLSPVVEKSGVGTFYDTPYSDAFNALLGMGIGERTVYLSMEHKMWSGRRTPHSAAVSTDERRHLYMIFNPAGAEAAAGLGVGCGGAWTGRLNAMAPAVEVDGNSVTLRRAQHCGHLMEDPSDRFHRPFHRVSCLILNG